MNFLGSKGKPKINLQHLREVDVTRQCEKVSIIFHIMYDLFGSLINIHIYST